MFRNFLDGIFLRQENLFGDEEGVHSSGADDHSQFAAVTDSHSLPAHLGFFHFKTPAGNIDVLACGVRSGIVAGAQHQPIPNLLNCLCRKYLHRQFQRRTKRLAWQQGVTRTNLVRVDP